MTTAKHFWQKTDYRYNFANQLGAVFIFMRALIFTWLFFAVVPLFAGKFLQASGMLNNIIVATNADFIGCCWLMWLLPNWLLEQNNWRQTVAVFFTAILATFSAIYFMPSLYQQIIGAGLIAGAFSAMIFVLAKIGVNYVGLSLGRVIAAIMTTLLMISPLWSALILATSHDDDWRIITVWLSPPTMLGTALTALNFSCLPDLYPWWLGSLCPLPTSIAVAIASYVIPAIIFAIIAQRKGGHGSVRAEKNV